MSKRRMERIPSSTNEIKEIQRKDDGSDVIPLRSPKNSPSRLSQNANMEQFWKRQSKYV